MARDVNFSFIVGPKSPSLPQVFTKSSQSLPQIFLKSSLSLLVGNIGFLQSSRRFYSIYKSLKWCFSYTLKFLRACWHSNKNIFLPSIHIYTDAEKVFFKNVMLLGLVSFDIIRLVFPCTSLVSYMFNLFFLFLFAVVYFVCFVCLFYLFRKNSWFSLTVNISRQWKDYLSNFPSNLFCYVIFFIRLLLSYYSYNLCRKIFFV